MGKTGIAEKSGGIMKQIAVFFPGIGYHCDKPLLYFGQRIARETGYQTIISLRYHCSAGDIRGNPEKMREVGLSLFSQAEETLKEILWEQYDDILFVSKSVGTAIAAAYAREHKLVCRNVFYTPVALTFAENPQNGIAFTGTRDPWVAADVVEEGCKQADVPLTVIQEADHSLETGFPMRDLQILKNVMTETRRYIQRGQSV